MRRIPILFGFLLVLAACGDSDGGGLFTEQTVGGVGVTASTAAEGDSGQGDEGGTVTEVVMLEELRSRCAAGDFPMCDILFHASEIDSELESFGDSCGGLVASSGDFCADQFGVPYDLRQLRAACGDGDMAACDLLFLYAPGDSLDEAFGDECGGVGEGANRTCVVSWGFVIDAG